MDPLVFGYGSLVAGAGGTRATLTGARRAWSTGMDNRRAVPGYKRYRDPATGAFPAVCVLFLDLVEDETAAVEGVVLERADLVLLDARERSYVRREVTGRLVGVDPRRRAWTYVGSPAGRARAAAARAAGTAVVQEAYVAAVEAAFAARGPAALARYRASTAAPGVPGVALERISLPAA